MKDSHQHKSAALTYAIVEDEYYTAREVKSLVSHLRPNYTLLRQAEDIEGMMELLQNYSVDLLIADINLSDGLCFEALNRLRENKLPIIFTSAYVQYRELARRYNMVDFLLKPYPAEQLEQAIMKFENNINL